MCSAHGISIYARVYIYIYICRLVSRRREQREESRIKSAWLHPGVRDRNYTAGPRLFLGRSAAGEASLV